MRVSYNRLQDYFDKKLPEPEKLAELLTVHSYEVEEISKTDDDFILNIDVLPNRQNDSSSEEGVAKELSAILDTPLRGKAAKSGADGLPDGGAKDLRGISVSLPEINRLLGISVSKKETEDILRRLDFEYEMKEEDFVIISPPERTDLKIKADLIEEIARIYGYENIEAKLPEKAERIPAVNKKIFYSDKIKDFLANEGFSEVYTYSFRDTGEIEIEKPLASDKNFLRKDLRAGLQSALAQNTKILPLLCGEDVRIFEIGNVFTKDGEHTALGIGYSDAPEYLEDIVSKLSGFIGIKIEGGINENIFEADFDKLVEKLPEPPKSYEQFKKLPEGVRYKPISPYPFALRDIAVWVPKGKASDDVLNIIKKEGGKLLVNTKLFDVFEREEAKDAEGARESKISYAFSLIFQSKEKTLSDDEVNKITERITEALNANFGWRVRD